MRRSGGPSPARATLIATPSPGTREYANPASGRLNGGSGGVGGERPAGGADPRPAELSALLAPDLVVEGGGRGILAHAPTLPRTADARTPRSGGVPAEGRAAAAAAGRARTILAVSA